MKWVLLVAIIFGLSAFILDAFFAHGLKNYLGDAYTDGVAHTLNTASRYQLMASFFLLITLLLWRATPHLCIIFAQVLVMAGVGLFCGTIYSKHLFGFATLARLAPVGGIMFMLSFLALLPLMLSW
jgi:uncharacterized membrane protein YgdD (TMEM256/DUF423 family)